MSEESTVTPGSRPYPLYVTRGYGNAATSSKEFSVRKTNRGDVSLLRHLMTKADVREEETERTKMSKIGSFLIIIF